MNTWYRSSIWVLCWCVLSIHSHPTDTTRRPAYVECVSSSECGFDSCCVLGMGRYSVPQCQKKLLLYESCRPNSDHPVNSTVAYLDGTMVSLNNVHLLMCPCANGLTCDHKTGRCEDFDTNSSFNEIDYANQHQCKDFALAYHLENYGNEYAFHYRSNLVTEMFKKAATELLSVKKDDVQSLLAASSRGRSEDIIKCLNLFPYFNGWSEKSIRECCILSSIKRFLPDTLILDCSDSDYGYTYFVIDGICTIVQKVVIQVDRPLSTRKVLKFHTDQSIEQDNPPNVEIIFVKLRNYTNGDCFGLGEDLTNRWIVSESAIRCLIIPRDFLLQHNQNNIWPRVRQRISATFPSNTQIYNSLNQQVKWCRFKNQYSSHLRRRKNITTTTLQDVPFYWQINVDVPVSLL